jgi:hypothetical protein
MGCELLVCWSRWELRGAANDEDVDARLWALRAPVGRRVIKCALQGVRAGTATTRPAQFTIAVRGVADAAFTRQAMVGRQARIMVDLLWVQSLH